MIVQYCARLALIIFCLVPVNGIAETLVFVQGYLGSAENWRDSGITGVLQRNGWQDAGHLSLNRQGVRVSRSKADTSKRFFTLDLPTDAPLQVQANNLAGYLEYIRYHYPGTALMLAGHSAGGVVARLYMVQHPDVAVAALITIASPHRGTESAELGLVVGQSPLALFAPLFGGEVFNRSQRLYSDLAREQPNNLLGWLNHQPHPPASYASIVRSKDDETFGLGNLIVPAWSQDMNQVYALRGRAWTIRVNGGHALSADDGRLLVKILARLNNV